MPDASTLTELGASLCATRRIGDAESVLLDARGRAPQPAARLDAKLAIVRLIQGRTDESIDLLRRAVAAEPGDAALHSKLIGVLAYHQESDTRTIKAEQRAWEQRHGAASAAQASGPRSTHGKLRIGYVARNFGSAGVARVFRPLITHADRNRFAVFCYSGTPARDPASLDLCFRVDGWRTAVSLDDAALDARIRQDAIDILVDLDGHMDGNRLPVFCRRPAPVQLSGWGYLPGPGISAISGFFTDPVIVPQAERRDLAESCLDLPCAQAYTPPDVPITPQPPPSVASGHVTFGCFNRVEKIGHDVSDVWAGILRAVAGSRLVLMDAAFVDATMRETVLARFAGAGIESHRIDLRPRQRFEDYLAAYHDVDIALDPWPHSGGLTTLDALWMGVPVVTRLGRHALGRTTASLLTCLGLTELVTADVRSYAETVCALACSPGQLAAWRGSLRQQLTQSVIGDASRYAHAVEDTYTRLWGRS